MNLQELKQLAIHSAKGTVPTNFSKDEVDVHAAFLDGFKELADGYNNFMKNRYEIFELIQAVADEILPNKTIDAISAFAEVQQVPQGAKPVFKQRLGRQRAKKFITQVGLSGVYETFRLDVDTFDVKVNAIGGGATIDYERMLDGAETLADCMDILLEGMQDAIFVEIQKALKAAFNATSRPAANKYTGTTWSAGEMVKLMNVVRSYADNCVIFAPPEFISTMGADAIVAAATNQNGVFSPDDIEAIHNTGFVRIFRGAPVVKIPQSFTDTDNNKTWIDPRYAYILPAGKDKVVKVVMEGNTNVRSYENRDGSIEVYADKKFGCAILAHNNWCIYENTGITNTYFGN